MNFKNLFKNRNLSAHASRSFHKLPVSAHHLLKNPNFHYFFHQTNNFLHPIPIFRKYILSFSARWKFSMEMASETGFSDQSSPTNSTYSAMPPFLPFMLGFTSTNLRQNSTNPIQETQEETQDQANHGESRDRIIFINPVTQTTFVMETSGGSMGWDSLFGDLFAGKSCQRPASKASIDALPSVEIVDGENGDEQCVVCLEEWEAGEMAKEMPCKHRFHADCIEKWLRINACCPVCRYQMPVDEDEDAGRKTREENGGERRRGIWVRFDFGGGWRNREIFQTSSDESRENGDSSSNHQSNHEIRQNIDSSSNHQETED